MKTSLIALSIFLICGCGTEDFNEGNSLPVPTTTNIQGLKSLYMGHSYFRRQAEAMQEYADLAGIDGHESTVQFYGGYRGSAAAIWNNESAPDSRDKIMSYLDAGDIQMFGMTIFVEDDVPEGDVTHIDSQTQGLKNWIEYAISKNPDTIFFVALPWLGGPLTYTGETDDPQTSGRRISDKILESEAVMTVLIDELRAAFPNEIFCSNTVRGPPAPYVVQPGELPDVDTLVSHDGLLGIHSDTHGHAEQLLTDLNSLIWLINLQLRHLQFSKVYQYETDIRQIAPRSQTKTLCMPVNSTEAMFFIKY